MDHLRRAANTKTINAHTRPLSSPIVIANPMNVPTDMQASHHLRAARKDQYTETVPACRLSSGTEPALVSHSILKG
jgi:hypothetical protein